MLNDSLCNLARNPMHRDELARFWTQQDPTRIFPTHCKYLTYHSCMANGAPCLVVPMQESTTEVLAAFQPDGFELPEVKAQDSSQEGVDKITEKKPKRGQRGKKSQKKSRTVEKYTMKCF